MKNKTYLLAAIVFFVGVLMLLGSSYSLITGKLVSDETYGFDVANFNVEFSDNAKVSISGVPMEDEDGIKNGREFAFTVTNNSDYDVNYRLDILENGNLNMSSVIHYVYRLNNSEYSDVINLRDNYTVKQNKVLKKNETDTYKIRMWLSIDADESFMNKIFSANISLNATQNEYKYASSVIEKLYSTNQDGIKEDNGNYRYSNKDSLNYVWFNCQNGFSKGNDYCHKWQIIGLFNNRKENSLDEYLMLKIVSSDVYDSISYNNDEKKGNYDNSYIETFANGSFYDKLSDDNKKLIMKAKWNIGNTKTMDYSTSLKEEEAKYYYGNVGLVNVSDYLYLKGNSFINNDKVLLLNKSDDNINVIDNILTTGENNESYGFLPCVYLRPDVSIISGDGSIDNPYELAIKYPMNY